MRWSCAVLALLLAIVLNSCLLLKTDERVDAVIAATDLSAGKQIADHDITITAVPVSSITQDVPRRSSQVVGHTTKVAIPKGAPILLSELK